MLEDKLTKKVEQMTEKELSRRLEEEEQSGKRSQSSQERNLTKDVKSLERKEERYKIFGSVDTFTPHQPFSQEPPPGAVSRGARLCRRRLHREGQGPGA